jgi:hypothetical protein
MFVKGSSFFGRSTLAVVGAALLVACGDATGPDGDLSDEDKQAIVSILTSTSALAASPAAGFAAFFLDGLDGFGPMTASAAAQVQSAVTEGLSLAVSQGAADAYDGFGFIVDFSVSAQGETFAGWMAGIVGMADLDLDAGTVGELVSAYLMDLESATAPSSGTGEIGEGTAFATYYDGATNFFGTSGTVAVTSSSFGGGQTDCGGSAQGVTVSCSYSTGTMAGNFDFEAQAFTGGTTYTQVPIAFSGLPAVRIALSTNVSN